MEAATKKSNHGANVRRWREWRGIKQEDIAEKIGVSQTSYSRYENSNKLEPEILEKIAAVLDIPVEAITEIEHYSPINIINAHNNQSIINYHPSFNPLDKVVELFEEKNTLYERMLKEKDSVIELLKEIVNGKK